MNNSPDKSKSRQVSCPADADHFSFLAEALPGFVWTADAKGIVNYVSSSWSEFSGLSEDHPSYLDWVKRVHQDDVEGALESWGHSVRTGEDFQSDFRIESVDGEYRWFKSIASAITTDSGKIVKWYGTVIDIQKIKEAEAFQKRASLQKEQFLAVLGHELRNPLSAIMSGLEIMKLGSLDKAGQDKALELISREATQLKQLADDTLDSSRFATGKLRLNRKILDLTELVELSLASFQHLAKEKNLTIDFDRPTTPISINADPGRIGQCLSNLLTNASKFTPDGGSISVELTAEPPVVQLSVADTGVGMEAEEIEKLFLAYNQGGSLFTNSPDGLGLGLSIVRNLVELHGGKVSALSEGKNRGSTFTIELPFCAESLEAPESPASAQSWEVKGLKVLVIDDSIGITATMKMFLESEGYSVRIATDSQSALASLRQEIPALIFCDLTLSNGDRGWDLAPQLLKALPSKSTTRLIAMSGHTQPEDIAKSLSVGFSHHLCKPLSLDAIRSILAGH